MLPRLQEEVALLLKLLLARFIETKVIKSVGEYITTLNIEQTYYPHSLCHFFLWNYSISQSQTTICRTSRLTHYYKVSARLQNSCQTEIGGDYGGSHCSSPLPISDCTNV